MRSQKKKRSAIVAIMWKPLLCDRNEHSNHMETSLDMGTAQGLKSQRPLNFFGSDRSDHMETSLKSL